jgi:hypothetical protein
MLIIMIRDRGNGKPSYVTSVCVTRNGSNPEPYLFLVWAMEYGERFFASFERAVTKQLTKGLMNLSTNDMVQVLS